MFAVPATQGAPPLLEKENPVHQRMVAFFKTARARDRSQIARDAGNHGPRPARTPVFFQLLFEPLGLFRVDSEWRERPRT
jgi:hypothetical protein